MKPNDQSTSGDVLSLTELQQLVQDSVGWWQQRLQQGQVNREDAAKAIEELRQALLGLSQRLAQGDKVMRITSSLSNARRFPLGCSRCGRGNRHGAKYCYVCGWSFATQKPTVSLKSPRLYWQTGVKSDKGRVRPVNQDSALREELTLPDGSTALLCLVADGMGGHAGGERASALACSTIQEELRRHARKPPKDNDGWKELLADSITQANARIHQQAGADYALRGMGTTAVLALVLGEQALLASVGDSRIYVFNRKGIDAQGQTWAQLTVDHTIVARLVDLGSITPQEALKHPQRHMLYRSVGVEKTLEVDTDCQPLHPGDRLLLCSDGLTNYVDGPELAQVVLKFDDPQAAVERLVALANERGGRDNITALLVVLDDVSGA